MVDNYCLSLVVCKQHITTPRKGDTVEQEKHELEGIGEGILNAFIKLREHAIKAELDWAESEEVLLDEDHTFEFDKNAYGFVVRAKETKTGIKPDFKMIALDGDIYTMLEDIGQDLDCARQITSSRIFGVFTQGWGVQVDPNDDDKIPPSKHPKRKRVRLVHLVSASGDTASAMNIEDAGETVTEMNSAGGGLAEAIRECVLNAVRQVEASNN